MNEYRWDDLHEGLEAQFEVTLAPSLLEQFRALSGDINPLHSDPDFARSLGFQDTVAFGLLTSAFYSQLIGVHLPGRYALLHGLDVDFHHPAYPGEVLTVHGRIAQLTDAFHRMEIRARISNSAGTLISKARIRVGLHVP